jgi:hypothetical protein
MKKMAVFWDVAPRSLVDTNRGFRLAYCLHHQGDATFEHCSAHACVCDREKNTERERGDPNLTF